MITAAGSRIGLVHEQKRKLRSTRRAICVADSDAELTLHFSAKESSGKDAGPVLADTVEFSTLTAVAMSPAGRILYAIRRDDEEIKNDWDLSALTELVDRLLAASVAARRALANEALHHEWNDVFDGLSLTMTERAWLRAHEAAAYGRVDHLLHYLMLLPDDGYPTKVALVQPYVTEVALNIAAWDTLLMRWEAADLPGAAQLRALVCPDWDLAITGGIGLLTATDNDARAEEWELAIKSLQAGNPESPLVDGHPSWAAAATYARARSGQNVDPELEHLVGLPLPLLDDVIDYGALTVSAPLTVLQSPLREHAAARLVPELLDDASLASVGHHVERARRRFLARDNIGLESLPDAPGVVHYRGLLDVVLGGVPDSERLSPDAVEVLDIATGSRAQLVEGAASVPVPVVLADPTLWSLFAEEARTGKISLSAAERSAHGAFAQWCDLQRIVGLLWDARWEEAERAGLELIPSLKEERYQDEALNLTAFAMHQQGRDNEALVLLERALDGSYTEALLVNTSLLAALVEPSTAAKYFALLVREAPTAELRRAAVTRAVGVWEGLPEDAAFPSELVAPLKDVLESDCPLDDYVRLLKVAGYASPAIVLGLVAPADERRGPLALQQARVKFRKDDNFRQKELVRAFIAVSREHGRTPWFDSEWARLVNDFREATFIDFGDAMGAAIFWDTLNVEAPDLFTPFQRLLLVPQAGAHMAAFAAKSNEWLVDDAFKKFFFLPAEEVIASREQFEPAEVEHLADNLGRSLTVATMHYASVRRSALADAYNSWADRLRWDTDNRVVIRQEMRKVLDAGAEALEMIDRVNDRLRRLPMSDEDRKTRIDILSSEASQWRAEVVRLRSNL